VPPESRLVADRFRVLRRLGAGAMASVFLAEDTELDRRVAIKRLHPDSGPESAPRFRREMRVAAGLSHPNIVTLFDAIEDDGAVLLVMEYVEGPSLAERLRDGPLPDATAIAILRPLAGAVDHLHEEGVIHRDIKPANILLDRNDRVKLADLGIASAGQATGITTTGTMLGTPAYMAPELFDGGRATPAADVFSLAAIAFEMFSGRRARESGTPAAIAVRAATAPPPDLRDDRPDAPALAAVLARGMARDPAARPPTATALVDEIAAALREDERPAPAPVRASREDERPAPAPVRASREDEPEPRTVAPAAPGRARRSPVLLLAGVAAFAAAVLAVLLLTGGGDPGSGDGDRAATGTSTATTAKSKSKSKSTSTGTGTGSGTGTSTATGTGTGTGTSTSKATGTGTGTGTGTTTSGTKAATAAASTPASAVRAFYERAAAHRYADAWAVAAPGLRTQLGGYDTFRRQFSTVRSIVFSRAAETRRTDGAATVAITTTATHTDRVDHCTGTADAAPATGGGWVVTHVDVHC